MEIINNLIVFIFGASIGSFLNVLIDRLPNGEPITGRSHCDYCKKKLSWIDLIPILSFIFLKGKSRCCKKKLSCQYLLVEVITGLTFVFIFKDSSYRVLNESLIGTVLIAGIVSCMIVIFFSDLKYHLISDYILIAFGIFSFLYKIFFSLKEGIQIPYRIGNDFLSGLIVALPIFLIYYISHERAMGLGDVYLSVIVGFLLGWKAGFIALYIAFVTGAIVGLVLIFLKRKKIKSKIAFGPFIIIGTVTMFFWSEKIFELLAKISSF